MQQQPWKLAKSQAEGAQDQLDAVLYTAAEYIRVITALVSPVLPATARKIWQMLGMPYPIEDDTFRRPGRSDAAVRVRRWNRSLRCFRESKPNRRSRRCRSSKWPKDAAPGGAVR